MLTFRFTGASGEMIEEEMLAAGMVGKQVRFEFSSDWDGLRKVAVYKAGSACCTSVDVGEVDTIPAEVLASSLHRLFVGIYGISENGAVVTPAVMAQGPFIHISTVMGNDPCFNPQNTFWIKLEQALEETVRFTPQVLTEEQQAQARKNIGVAGASGGLSTAAAAALMTILKNGVYVTDQSKNITNLEALLEDEAVLYYTITHGLTNVSTSNAMGTVAKNGSFTTVLTAASGYTLKSVTVTMGGVDVTAQVYANGTVTIPAVTGNVVITASAAVAAEEEPETYFAVTMFLGHVSADNAQQSVASGASYSTVLTAEDGYTLGSVTVTMDGKDITAQVYGNGTVTIPAVTGNVVITASASIVEEETVSIFYVSATVTDNGAGHVLANYDANNTVRMTVVTTENVADTPFPQHNTFYDGDLYLLPVPETATALKVTSPGFVGGPQFFTLSNGAYRRTLDAGWQTADGFTYPITAGAHHFVAINFKKADGSGFNMNDVDTSVFIIEFETAESGDAEDDRIIFVPASASASTIDLKDPAIRMCTVMLSGETPFPQNGQVYAGNLYPIPVPAGATVLKVTSPGLIGGVQFYTLANGTYTSTLDTGWQAEGGFNYTFEADAYDCLIVNFKNSSNTAFFTEDYDTSGISISFE